jgi:hypothetical protein
MPEADQDLDGYPGWDLAPLPVPPRSHLYHLAPIGVGTPEVESLTGYLVRLAAAHSVTPFVLARREIMPAFAADRRAEIEWQLGALMGRVARRLNGVEADAGRWVEVLATLTGRPDLCSLTMRPWAGVIASRDLLRATLAWCPACYTARRTAGQEIYQPLLWTLQAVTVCARHHQLLQDRCAACDRPQPLIAPAIRPGYCTACDHWLGEPDGGVQGDTSSLPAASLAWKCWVADAVGEMLAFSPRLAPPFPPGQVKAIIEECVASLGGDALLRSFPHLAWNTIDVWRRGPVIPSLESLLRLCHYLGTTPRPFVLLGAGAMVLPSDHPPMLPDAPRPRRPRGSFDVEAARRGFLALVAGSPDPLPSIPQMARHLGCTDWHLRRYLPAECRTLIEHRKAQRTQAVREAAARRCTDVRRATITVHAQGHYPNARRVSALLDNPLDLIRVEVRAAWQETLRELGWQPRNRKGTYLA